MKLPIVFLFAIVAQHQEILILNSANQTKYAASVASVRFWFFETFSGGIYWRPPMFASSFLRFLNNCFFFGTRSRGRFHIADELEPFWSNPEVVRSSRFQLILIIWRHYMYIFVLASIYVLYWEEWCSEFPIFLTCHQNSALVYGCMVSKRITVSNVLTVEHKLRSTNLE